MRPTASLLFAAAVAVNLFGAEPADARVQAESRYTKAQTFSGALRYLRVDLGYPVVEKDPEAAYLLFEYEGEQRRGSIEVVEHRGEVRIYVQLPKMPRYHEQVLRDGLLRKLRDEYGEPAPKPPPKPPKKAKPDAGADGEDPDAGA